ncbi:MAG TPA: RsmE family RNA methyltransferase [Phycisphaerae bacterium]|nr:RsmE family RNA methyltransferase [Phycisphaerae bacterium]
MSDAVISVEGDEAIHALRVLRLKAGKRVVLFDGAGGEVGGMIRSVGRSSFEVEVLERREQAESGGPRLIIAVAAPKGERADWLVEKCAELGVSALMLLRCKRGEVLPGEGKIQRWRRKAVQAAKQARLAAVTTVEAPRGLSEILDSLPVGARIWCADPDKAHPTFVESLRGLETTGNSSPCDVVFVGPEGGFAPEEIEAIQRSGGLKVRLCRPVLRVETAAVAAACFWAAWRAESQVD